MILHVQRTGCKHRFCQDRFYYKYSTNDESLILIVADGHGGTPYVRSGLGARMAVKAAANVFSDISIPVELYPRYIKQKFDTYIHKHLRLHPINNYEKEKLLDNPDEYAYGTTLIAAKITGDSTYLLHIGDGEVHAVKNNGEFFPELPIDRNCFLNGTSSLVTGDAIDKIRTALYPETAACVILHTDGYKPVGKSPWNIYEKLSREYTKSDIFEEVAAHQNGNDDQTVLLYFDDTIDDLETFHAGIRDEKSDYISLVEKTRLQRKIKDLEAFLKTALIKYRLKYGNEKMQFKEHTIEPRYKEYMELQKKLSEM